jgi:3-deoxy-manno-octulosonate cytidylyltransferase (CMP-KDO synthetase)
MKRNKIVAMIPARMSATRFPGKPLQKMLGLSMIEHVRRRVIKSNLFDEVYVATCDQAIIDEVERYNGKALMTKNTHERCTDRIEEASQKIDADIIVNIQGDEPVVMAESLKKLIAPFLNDPSLQTTNIVNQIFTEEDLRNLNIVKAVLSSTNKILYMSRAGIPGKEFDPNFNYYKQTGLMAFRKDLLHTFSKLAPTPLEIKESCDMLRLVEHDYSIQGIICDHKSIGVDVPEQVAQVEDYILSNPEQKLIYESIR